MLPQPSACTDIYQVQEQEEEKMEGFPFPESQRAAIMAFVRGKQDVTIKKMKRKWDTTNTVVCI
jgi:hypothetical protein